MIPLGPWEPDRSKLAATDGTYNALPHSDGWAAMPSLNVYSAALGGVCRGALLARNTDGTFSVFAATATAIYRTSGTTWEDVTRTVGGAYGLADGDSWFSFQFGNTVYFGNVNDALQSFDLGSSTDFADVADAPQCRYGAVAGDYIILASTAAEPQRLHRSGVNAPTVWVTSSSGTRGNRGADYQDMPDGGWIRGVVGQERGCVIFQDTAIRILEDQPGSALLFTIAKAGERGVVASDSIVQVGSRIFFRAEDGFYEFSVPEARNLSVNRIERWFQSTLSGDIADIQGAADPARQIVWWRDESRLIGYNWALDRWFHVAGLSIEWLLSAATPGYTLEELDTVLGYTNLETIPYSLDSRIWKGGRPTLGCFNSDHKLAFFEGTSMAAVIEANEGRLGGEGRRAVIAGMRPVGDIENGTVTGQVGVAETMGAVLSYTAAASQNVSGLIPLRASGRVLKPRLITSQTTDWVLTAVEVPPEHIRQAGRR